MARDLLRPVPLGIYFLSFVVGVVGALILPTFSVFLAQELGVRPLLVGLPFAGLGLASIGYNQLIGYWSDKLTDRRPLIAGFCLVGAVTCATFALSRNYWLVISSAVCFLSLAMVSFSQMLAYSLDFAERCLPAGRIPLFNAIVRAQIALAWVAGPPAGFLLAAYLGFSSMYWIAGSLFIAVGLVSLKLLPRLDKPDAGVSGAAPEGDPVSCKTPRLSPELKPQLDPKLGPEPLAPDAKRALLLCLVAFSLMWCANNAYLISLPLHLSNNLDIGTEWVGWVMGTCALLEVPVMLLAGYLAAGINLMTMVRMAGVAGMLLYAGVLGATHLWQLFALQILNAMFVGVLAGLGVSVIQALLPGRSGSASALYTNTTHVGTLLSSLQVGLVADLYGYQHVFTVNLVVIILAIMAFLGVRPVRN